MTRVPSPHRTCTSTRCVAVIRRHDIIVQEFREVPVTSCSLFAFEPTFAFAGDLGAMSIPAWLFDFCGFANGT